MLRAVTLVSVRAQVKSAMIMVLIITPVGNNLWLVVHFVNNNMVASQMPYIV